MDDSPPTRLAFRPEMPLLSEAYRPGGSGVSHRPSGVRSLQYDMDENAL
jgi:hypothetical protein